MNNGFKRIGYKGKLKDEKLREVFSFLRLLSKSGISLEESVHLMDSSLRAGNSLDFKKIIFYMNEGKTLCKALALVGLEDRFVLSIIEISELAGKLPEAFVQLENYYLGKIETKSELFKSFAYPFTVLLSIIFLFIGIFAYIVPNMVNDFFVEGDTLPSNLKFIMALNDFLRENIFFIFTFFSLILVTGFVVSSNKEMNMALRKYLAEKSIFSVVIKKSYIKNFGLKVYILLQSGMDIYSTINVVKDIEKSEYYKQELKRFEKALLSGESITKVARDSNFCDQVVETYIDKGYETDNMVEAFYNIWVVHDRYMKEYIKKLKTTIQPMMIMILGIIVALMAMIVMSITDVSNFISEVNY